MLKLVDMIDAQKEMPKTQGTVQVLPDPDVFNDSVSTTAESLVIQLAQTNSNFTPWGQAIRARDLQLAAFWKTEPFLASAIHSIIMTRASLTWELTGPPKSVNRVQELLKRSDFGRGWQSLISKVVLDLLTADNGAFIEIVRSKPRNGRKPESGRVIALNHLQSLQCLRTGNPESPVIYTDTDGVHHLLKWYQVATLSEIPIPNEENKNVQFSFVSRVLQMAETMQSIAQYHKEKITGQFSQAIHVVSGVSQTDIENIQRKGKLNAQNMGNINFMSPLILSTIDPSSNVSKVTLELAGLPDKFNYNEMLVWYITLLALASGSDYMDFSPLPGKGLGTAAQSDSLAQKSKVKGILLFMKLIEHALHSAKVIPPNVSFKFSNTDAQAERENAEIGKIRAETRKIQIEDGEVTPEIARQIAVDFGDIRQEHLIMMGEGDNGSVTIRDDETVSSHFLSGVTADELPSVDTEVDVPIDVADKAGKWIQRLITEHPVQSANPIPSTQLNTLAELLRNWITKETSVGTDIWMDYILVKAAIHAGIHPHALRYRLPDNYRLVVKANGVFDNRGSTIYVKKEVKESKPDISLFLNGLTYDNYNRRAEKLVEVFGGKLTAKHMLSAQKVGYFSDTALKVKLMDLYYQGLLA